MNTEQTNLTEQKSKRDPDFVGAEAALKRAAKRARQRARQAGIGVVVLRDGRIVEERSDNTE